jgi:hypothetical protein
LNHWISLTLFDASPANSLHRTTGVSPLASFAGFPFRSLQIRVWFSVKFSPLYVYLCVYVVQFSNMLNQKGWDPLSLVQKCIRKEPGGDPPGKLFDAVSVSLVPNSSCVWFVQRVGEGDEENWWLLVVNVFEGDTHVRSLPHISF